MITEEKLMAYVDGEIPAGEREAVEAAIAGDDRLKKALAGEKRLRRALAELYGPALEEELPESLTRLLGPHENRVVPLKKPSVTSPVWGWGSLAAMAASLVLGVFLGFGLDRVPSEEDEAGLRVEGQLATALQTQLASTQSPAAPIQVGISFIGPDGQPCRTFESSEAAGLACRSGENWQLRLLAPGGNSRRSEYQQAGSASSLVMSSAQELIVGEPMNARQERQARDAGWLSRSD
jgi:hypothetical protein